MQRQSKLVGTFLLLAGMLHVGMAQEPKADPAKKPTSAKSGKKENVQTKEKMLSSGRIRGKLTHVEGSQRYFVLQVKYVLTKPNFGAMQNVANASQNIANARRNNDTKGVASAQLDLLRNQANMYDFVTIESPMEFIADDKMKIRTMLVPLEYDDKGKPRRLTTKEIKERKGDDPTLPGFDADFDSLRQGQWVEVHIEKQPLPKGKPAKDADLGDGKDKKRYKALMVVIVAESPK
jgi:hypothetical protein